jgi:hypothetical protein
MLNVGVRDVGSSRSATRLEVVIAVLGTLNAVAAFAGAYGLASGWLTLSDGLESRLPWGSGLVGGVALGLFVAAPNSVLAVLARRHDRRAGRVAVVVGILLVVWILVEVAFIRQLSFFQPLYVGIGLVMAGLGNEIRHRTEATAPGLPRHPFGGAL